MVSLILAALVTVADVNAALEGEHLAAHLAGPPSRAATEADLVAVAAQLGVTVTTSSPGAKVEPPMLRAVVNYAIVHAPPQDIRRKPPHTKPPKHSRHEP